MPEKPTYLDDVATLRAAARAMRERAEAAFAPWHGWGDKSLPQRSGVEEWKADMDGYLGGEWGEYAASWHPVVALSVAHWLDMEAATRGELEPFTDLLNAAIQASGGPEAMIRFGRDKNGEIAMRSDTFDCALAVAKAYLGMTGKGS